MVLCLAGLLGFYLWLNHNRFAVVSSEGVAYKVDRRTGKSWVLFGRREIPISEESEAKETEMPSLFLPGLRGHTATVEEDGSIRAWVYNETSWRVEKLLVELTIRFAEAEGPRQETRKCMLDGSVSPYTLGSFYGTCFFGEEVPKVGEWSWQIVGAYGYENSDPGK